MATLAQGGKFLRHNSYDRNLGYSCGGASPGERGYCLIEVGTKLPTSALQ
jgi:hypothetical protein